MVWEIKRLACKEYVNEIRGKIQVDLSPKLLPGNFILLLQLLLQK